MSLKSQETPTIIGEMSSAEEERPTIKDRDVLMKMIKGGLREDQILRLQNAGTPERLLSALEKLGKETPINLTDAGSSRLMRFKGVKVYTRYGNNWHEETAPVSPESLRGTVFWGLLEGALAGEGTIYVGGD